MTNVDPKNVLVVHGRNETVRKAMFDFLRSLELHPIEWNVAVKATGKSSPYVGDILSAAFSMAKAIIVLFTPDDEVRLRKDLLKPNDPSFEGELTPQARPNVLFEAGMAMGRNEAQTILVEVGPHRSFSDVHGRHVIRLDNSPQSRQSLLTRLQSAGCDLNRDGTDWIGTGDFESWAMSENAAVSDENLVNRDATSKSFSGRQLSKIVTNCTIIIGYSNDVDKNHLEDRIKKLVVRNLPRNDLKLSVSELGDALQVKIGFSRIMLKSQIDEFERRVRNELDEAVLRWLADFDPAELIRK